ncbi:uncharacterized protein LOC113500791 [Trichoplusia ni]|uniref:Uncharacterized protein LOC113500791 n=1 Tax=Trichoplusia ni TaxID=7111 RepID=A0A7E5W9Y0_TRINI|nr:uncharacterized protein LOC113500791 [Trichoplusia ni]
MSKCQRHIPMAVVRSWLLEFFETHPYFQVKYERSTDPAKYINDRKDFKVVCADAAVKLRKNNNKVERIMADIVYKYAKIKLLISSGIVTEEDIRGNSHFSLYVSHRTDFLKLFVSGFTKNDIPIYVRRYFDRMFSEKKLIKRKHEVTPAIVKCKLQRLKDRKMDLHEDDEEYITNIISKSLYGFDGNMGYEIQLLKAIGIQTDDIIEDRNNFSRQKEASSNPTSNSKPGTERFTRNSDDPDEIKEEFSNDGVLNNNDCFVIPPQSIGSILPHPNIKNEIIDFDMDIVDPRDSDSTVENIVKDISINKTLDGNFSDINYKNTTEVCEISSIEEASQDGTAMDTSMNSHSHATPSVLPVKSSKEEISVVVAIENHGVLGVEDEYEDGSDIGAVDIRKYMNGLAELLCKKMPKERRRTFLNQIDQIVYAVLEE